MFEEILCSINNNDNHCTKGRQKTQVVCTFLHNSVYFMGTLKLYYYHW